jgi:hypothetical protein
MAPIVVSAIRNALAWLAKRGKGVSKHIGHHTHSAANAAARNPRFMSRALGRTPHSVFRDPRPKKLIERALNNPTRGSVQRNGYVVVEKEFNRVIGKGGETALKVIINPRTGRIVTAYPIRVGALGVISLAPGTIVGAEFDERVDQTIVNIDRMIDEYERTHPEPEFNLVEEIIDFLLAPTPAGDRYEGLYVQIEMLVNFQIEQVVRELEKAIGTPLSSTQRSQIGDQFRNAVAGVAAGTLDE